MHTQYLRVFHYVRADRTDERRWVVRIKEIGLHDDDRTKLPRLSAESWVQIGEPYFALGMSGTHRYSKDSAKASNSLRIFIESVATNADSLANCLASIERLCNLV